MILYFRHKGLQAFYEVDKTSKFPPAQLMKIRLILSTLDAAGCLADVNKPGFGLHPLTGNYKGFYAVKVNKNYRIIFQFVGEDVSDVDYLDYH